LSNNLEALGDQWMRSLFLETDQTIQISLDDGRTYYQVVQGDYIGLTWMEFQRIYIKVTTAADISLWATTNPDAILSKLKADSARTSAIYRQLLSALDCSLGTVTLTTTFVANFEIAGIWVKFSSAVSPTVALSRVSATGAAYKTLMRSTDLTTAQNVYYQFAKGEGRITAGDTLEISITTCAAIAYIEILTEDV
jgi:hypothetical protein